jgi:hypothetical protein
MSYKVGRCRRGLFSQNQFPMRRWSCVAGVSVTDLAAAISHGQIGVTTVGAIRQMGGDVVRTTGRSPSHATVTGLTPEQLSGLLTPTIPNPTLEV